jgi:hypothetical protein
MGPGLLVVAPLLPSARCRRVSPRESFYRRKRRERRAVPIRAPVVLAIVSSVAFCEDKPSRCGHDGRSSSSDKRKRRRRAFCWPAFCCSAEWPAGHGPAAPDQPIQPAKIFRPDRGRGIVGIEVTAGPNEKTLRARPAGFEPFKHSYFGRVARSFWMGSGHDRVQAFCWTAECRGDPAKYCLTPRMRSKQRVKCVVMPHGTSAKDAT